MDKLLKGFLQVSLNLSEEELSELLYKKGEDGKLTDELVDNALEILKGKDAERVAALKKGKGPDSDALESQRKRGFKEGAKSVEDYILEKFGIQSDAKGTDLVDAAFAAASKPPKLDEAGVKAHPLYLQLEKDSAKTIADLKQAHIEEINLREAQSAQKGRASKAKEIALEVLTDLNPIFPEVQAVADNIRDLYLREFESFDYQFDGSEKDPLVMKEGERFEDSHGHGITLRKLAQETAARYYQFKKQDGKGGAGNSNSGSGGSGSSGSFKAPKSQAEAWALAKAAKTPEERAALMEALESLD